MREQGEGSCTKQNKAQNAQIAAQSSLVCVQRSKQHKDRPEASQLNCPKQNSQLSAPYKSSHQTYQLLTPNKSINSPQNYHLPDILSNLNFHQNDQLPTQGRCGYWIVLVLPF